MRLRFAKNRLQGYAAAVNDEQNARRYYALALDLASEGDGQRPEIAEAKAYIHAHPH